MIDNHIDFIDNVIIGIIDIIDIIDIDIMYSFIRTKRKEKET